MPSKRAKKRKGADVDLGNVLDIKEQVSTFLKKSEDSPSPKKKRKKMPSSPKSEEDTKRPTKSKKKSADNESTPTKREPIAEDEKQRLRELSILRKKRSLEYPKLFLGESYKNESKPKISTKSLSIADVQDLVLHSLAGVHDTMPSWCKLVRPTRISKVALVILDGVSEECYEENQECFKYVQEHFDVTSQVDVKMNQNVTEDLLFRPVTEIRRKFLRRGTILGQLREKREKKKNKGKEKKKEKEEENNSNETKENCGSSPEGNSEMSPEGKTAMSPEISAPRTPHLLSPADLEKRNFPTGTEKHFKSTNHSTDVNDTSPLFGLDCEMCTTAEGNELTRVSVVKEDGTTLFNSLVKPKNPIINYQTRYSGITKDMLDPVETRLKHVQKEIIGLLPPEAILVGQSIENDLRALKLHHPHIIDTSRLFTSYPVALKRLAKFYLDRDIQCAGAAGHDSVEDALASLDLAKLKIQKGDELKSFDGNNNNKSLALYKESIFIKAGTDIVSMIVDSDSFLKRLYKEPVGCISTSNDTETRKKAVTAIETSRFVWAQFHSYRTYLEGTTQVEEEQKDLLSKLDGRIKKIYKALPEKSLVIMLMCGDTKGKLDSEDNLVGRVFATIKMSPLIVD